MTIDQLKYFVEIVKVGSISKAAENLYISQPTISLMIKHLEEEIGYKLFIRSSRGVELTGKGAEFLNYAETILININNMVKLKSTKPVEHLSVTISSLYISASIIPFTDLIKNHFHNSCYKIQILQKSVFSLINDVVTGISKIGILSISAVQYNLMNEKLLAEGLEFVEIIDYNIGIVMSLDHPLSERDYLTINDLKAYPLVYFEYSEKEFFAAKAFRDLGIDEFDKKIIVSDMFHTYHLMHTIHAITFSMDDSNYSFNALLKMHDLEAKIIPFKPSITMKLGYIKKINSKLNSFEQEFIDSFNKIRKSNL